MNLVTAQVGEYTMGLSRKGDSHLLHIEIFGSNGKIWEHDVTWREYVELVRAIAIAHDLPVYIGAPRPQSE